MMAGTVKFFREQIQLSHPEWMVLPDGDPEVDRVVGSAMLTEMYAVEAELTDDQDAAGADFLAQFDRPIIPMYPATRDIQTWDIWGAVRRVLAHRPQTADALSEADRNRRGLITTAEAIEKIHLPETDDDITAASARLKFDEALAIQTVLAQRRLAGRNESAAACPHVPGGLEDRLAQRLPFELTAGQRTVVGELLSLIHI